MPKSGQGGSHDSNAGWQWVVSSGLAAILGGGLIWVGVIDERVSTLKGADSRLTALEIQVRDFATQQDRVERKVDRLLEGRYGSPGPATSIERPER